MNDVRELNKRIFQSGFRKLCNINKGAFPASFHIAGFLQNGKLIDVFSSSDLPPDGSPLENKKYPIASMTKVFCAAAILKLRDENFLDLDSKVSDFIPNLQFKPWDKITVSQLLSMNSGLPYDNPWGDRLIEYSDQQLLDVLQGGIVLASQPGEAFNYSNLGYIVLGMIISSVSSMHCLNYIQTKFLRPLLMHDTIWLNGKDSYIDGYDSKRTFSEPVPFSTITSASGMFGGLASSVKDLAIWVNFLGSAFHHNISAYDLILSAKSRVELQTAKIKFPNTRSFRFSKVQTHYAMGLNVYESNGSKTIGHSGGLPGYGSHFRWSINDRIGIIFLSNLTYNTGSETCGEIIDEIADNVYYQSKPIDTLLETRANQLDKIIRTSDFSCFQNIFSSNFFLDNDKNIFKEKLTRVRSLVQPEEQIMVLAEAGLSAQLVYSKWSLFFSLSPAEDQKIQEIIFESI